jgi:hypothetical protein
MAFKDLRQGWRGDMDERARAIQAAYLAKLPQKCLVRTTCGGREVLSARLPQGARIGINYDGVPWTPGQWKNILRQAAGLSEKSFDCTELEKWVWWCYPVFRRYGWNAREVLECCCKRFDEDRTGLLDKDEGHFRRYWMTRGLRYSGSKQKLDRTPPLAEFVSRVGLPDPGKMWGESGRIPYGKKTLSRNT